MKETKVDGDHFRARRAQTAEAHKSQPLVAVFERILIDSMRAHRSRPADGLPMTTTIRNPLLIPLLSLWSLAAAMAYCLHLQQEGDMEALENRARTAFAREVRLIGAQQEKSMEQNGKALSGATPLQLPTEVSIEYALIDQHQNVLRASRPEKAGMRAEDYLGREVLDQFPPMQPGTDPAILLSGNRLIGAYPLAVPAPGGPLSLLILSDDLAPEISDLSGRYHKLLAALGATTTLLSVALYLHVLFGSTRFLTRIGETISRFGGGDSQARTGIAGDDIIARLGQQFDAMADRIAHERQDLAESEERLKFALHGSNAGIWDWQLGTGHIYYSPRWKSLLGFTENELPAHAEEWLKRVHPDDLSRVMELLDAHLNGQTEFFESEHRLRRKDNTYMWVLERGTAIRNDGRAYRMVGALTDISRRKEAEAALQRSKEAYRSVVEGLTQVIFRADDRGCLSFLNPAWTELTGFAVETSLSHPLADFVLADDRDALQSRLRALSDGDSEKAQGELRLLGTDNKPRWFSLHARKLHEGGTEIGIAGVLTDIDTQKAALHALSLSNTQRKAILDLSPDGFVFIDRQGKVEYVNPAFQAMTALSSAEIEGVDLAELENRMAALCAPQSPPPAFSTAGGRELMLTLQKPGKMILKWQIRTIRDELGDPQLSVLYFRDVTRETEVDRMKTEFLSTAAHELRTPMASIFGFSELLLARQYDAATQRDLIQTIHRQTKNLIDLVNELLDLARIEARGGKSFKIEEQELAPIVLAATSAMYLPSETHRMEVALPDNLPRVKIDADKFKQCLANVLSNALKYSPDGGEIHVSAKRRKIRDGEQVGIAVRDTGIGMTSEQLGRIFERFYRANPASGIPGTGLGMALVKEIMTIFGGEVSIESSPGQGTEVTLWLEAIRPATE